MMRQDQCNVSLCGSFFLNIWQVGTTASLLASLCLWTHIPLALDVELESAMNTLVTHVTSIHLVDSVAGFIEETAFCHRSTELVW